MQNQRQAQKKRPRLPKSPVGVLRYPTLFLCIPYRLADTFFSHEFTSALGGCVPTGHALVIGEGVSRAVISEFVGVLLTIFIYHGR